MSDEQDPWDRQGEDEPNLWYDRFSRFLLLGPSRSVRAVYLEETPKDAERRQNSGIPKNWYEIAKEWNWKERAEAWDEHRRKQVFTQGNAYDVARVEKLNKYSEMIEAEIDKMMTALAKRKKIAKPWFNHFMFEKYLQTLEAIADETGGRIKTVKQEVTGKDGGPMQTILCLPDNGDDDVIPPLIDEQERNHSD